MEYPNHLHDRVTILCGHAAFDHDLFDDHSGIREATHSTRPTAMLRVQNETKIFDEDRAREDFILADDFHRQLIPANMVMMTVGGTAVGTVKLQLVTKFENSLDVLRRRRGSVLDSAGNVDRNNVALAKLLLALACSVVLAGSRQFAR